jgi:hypothetical protein
LREREIGDGIAWGEMEHWLDIVLKFPITNILDDVGYDDSIKN